MKVYFVIVVCAFSACFAAWQENVRPKMYVQLGEFVLFAMNQYVCLNNFIALPITRTLITFETVVILRRKLKLQNILLLRVIKYFER